MIKYTLQYRIKGQEQGGINNRGFYEILICSYDVEFYGKYAHTQAFSLSETPNSVTQFAEKYSGIGDFENHPSIEEISARIKNLESQATPST